MITFKQIPTTEFKHPSGLKLIVGGSSVALLRANGTKMNLQDAFESRESLELLYHAYKIVNRLNDEPININNEECN